MEGMQLSGNLSVFPYNIIENLSTSVAHNSLTIGSNCSKFSPTSASICTTNRMSLQQVYDVLSPRGLTSIIM